MRKVLSLITLAALLQGSALLAIGDDRRAERSCYDLCSSAFRKIFRNPFGPSTRITLEKSGEKVVAVWIFNGKNRPAPEDRTSFSYQKNPEALEGFYPDDSLKNPGARKKVFVHVGKQLLSRYASLEALISHLWKRTPSHKKNE